MKEPYEKGVIAMFGNSTRTRRSGSSSGGSPKRTGDVEEKGNRDVDFQGFTHISGKNRLGRFMVRGKTIRKRSEPSCDRFSSSFGCGYSICASNRKMAEVRRARSFPPLRGTREPRESGDVAGPAACAVVAHCSPPPPETPVHVDAHLALAQRWLPQPRTLHPFSDARFAATYLR